MTAADAAASGGPSPHDRRDLNCSDFPDQASAQNALQPGDPDGLDADGDGIACESNPCPCSDGGGGGGGGGNPGGGGGGGGSNPAPPQNTTEKSCGKFRGAPRSRVCIRAKYKGGKLEKVKSFRFKRLPVSCGGAGGSAQLINGKAGGVGARGKRFNTRRGKILGRFSGERIYIGGKLLKPKKGKGIVIAQFRNNNGDLCKSGRSRWKT